MKLAFNRQILASLMVIGLVAAAAGSTTLALFSDTETSPNNTFAAGDVDLGVDVDSLDEDDEFDGTVLYGLGPNAPELPSFFNEADVKPGDRFERTLSFHADSNPYYLCGVINNIHNDDNGVNEPEGEFPANDVTGGEDEGELAQQSNLLIWVDDGDNIYEPGDGEMVIVNRTAQHLGGDGVPTSDIVWPMADSDENVFLGSGPLMANTTYYLGVEYSVPTSTGNIAQTDSYTADVMFYAVQSRNNDAFQCDSLLGNDQ